MDDLGYPLIYSLKLVSKILKDLEIENKVKVLAAGKLLNSGKQIMAMAMGAKACFTARGFLFSLGCIQALRCHSNNCPTGITTHDPSLMKGLDIEEKSERVKNYALNTIKSNYQILGALGLKNFKDLREDHLIFPTYFNDFVRSMK